MTRNVVSAVVIGASAGGVQALLRVLPALPSTYPLPILVVVHVPSDRPNALVPLLQSKSQVSVKEAEDKEIPAPGTVYFAPADYHLLVETNGALALSSDEPLHHSRPAIDILFETAADAYGSALVGIVLTGANHDGASGLRAVAAAGGISIAQDPAEADVPTMPAAALTASPGARVMRLDDLPAFLLGLVAQ